MFAILNALPSLPLAAFWTNPCSVKKFCCGSLDSLGGIVFLLAYRGIFLLRQGVARFFNAAAGPHKHSQTVTSGSEHWLKFFKCKYA